MERAFKTLQFSNDAIESIWKMVAVILHLGNLEFSADENDNASLKGNEIAVQRIAKMLNVGENDLNNALTTRVIAAAGQVMKRPHTLKEAETAFSGFKTRAQRFSSNIKKKIRKKKKKNCFENQQFFCLY